MADIPTIRLGHDRDAEGIIGLIWSCWSRYPGVRMDVDGEMPELRALATYYAEQGGQLWIAEAGGKPVGMIATRPAGKAGWEICRVYVDPALHGGGLGHALLDVAERRAMEAGAERLFLFSDTRFDRAHRFYEKRCYVRQGPIRVLADISDSLEFGYAKPVNGEAVLDIAAANAAIGPLAGLLLACAEQPAGAAGFLPPLALAAARTFFRSVASAVGVGSCVVAAAWRGGMIAGAGWASTDMPQDQAHRADLQAVLVHPSVRDEEVGSAVIQALETRLRQVGRRLLTLTCRAGDVRERICPGLGWRVGGCVPGAMRGADGAEHDGVLLWKRLD